jgi:4-hydroxy-2-oxoheptanedioate aldolase
MLGEPGSASAMATAGFDWVCLDGQHGAFDRGAVVAALARATDAWSPVLVRVPSHDAASIGAALDAGATGVIVPLVDDAEGAASVVRAALYPPNGGRSWGPMTPMWQRAAPSPAEADARTEVWVMLETATGLAAAPEILSTPGVTGAFVGPYDLSISLGVSLDELLAGERPDDPLPSIVSAARDAGVRAGAFAGSPERGTRLAALGFDSVAVQTDAGALAAGAAAALGRSGGGSGY